METKMMLWCRRRLRDRNSIGRFLWFLLCSPVIILAFPLVCLVKLYKRTTTRKDQNNKKHEDKEEEEEEEEEGKGRKERIEIKIEGEEEEEAETEEEEEEELMERYLEDQLSLIDGSVYYDSGDEICVVIDVGRDDLQKKVTRGPVSLPLTTEAKKL